MTSIFKLTCYENNRGAYLNEGYLKNTDQGKQIMNFFLKKPLGTIEMKMN